MRAMLAVRGLAISALVAVSMVGGAGAVATSAPGPAVSAAAAAPAPLRCSAPALAGPVKIAEKVPRVEPYAPRDVRRVVDVLRPGPSSRAQSIALMVWLGVNDPDASPLRLGGTPTFSTPAFYRRLERVEGWASLPPGVAAHRVMGSADPYVWDDYRKRSVVLLAAVAGVDAGALEARLTSGAGADRICRPGAGAKRGFPLPAGTGYDVVAAPGKPGGKRDGKPGGKPGSGATGSPVMAGSALSTVLVRSHCGIPVLAASTGVVRITRDVRASGPWLVEVVQEDGVTTSYAHVGRPTVKAGRPVVVGDRIASVGDYGDVGRCALGFSVSKGDGRLSVAESLTWLRPVPLVPPKPPDLSRELTEFRMATFNVLGSNLTGPGSSRPQYGPGPGRMSAGLGVIEASGASIVSFQEFQGPQADVVVGDGDWGLHRATGNDDLGGGNFGGNAIGWRLDTWELVDTDEFDVPYRYPLYMPVVHLKNKQTGGEVLVVSVHNPATTAKLGNQAGARAVARGTEKAEIAALREETGLPVILGGDMNEGTPARCDFNASGLVSSGGCSGGYGGIDLIFGSGEVAMLDLIVNNSTLGGISDHPLVTSGVIINPDQ